MKKKLIALAVLVVLVVCVALTGCTFIKVNNERKANEIMATVSIKDGNDTLSLDITRNELLSYVNYIINLYSQYGMSYDAADLINQGLEALINQKYLVLQGMVYLKNIESRQAFMYANTEEYKAVYGNKLTPEGVLTVAERYVSIGSTNESFVSSIKTYVSDYETEQRELLLTNAKESLAGYYADGYTVKENGVEIVHTGENGYEDGLYQTSFVSDDPTYENIVLKITVSKSGASDKVVYLPAGTTSVTNAEDEDAEFVSNYITAKICKVTYDEPVTDENGETAYTTHTAEAKYTLVTPRTAYKGEDEKKSDEDLLKDEAIRYATMASFKDATEGTLFDIYNDGQIFEHTLKNYASEAEKDAYRQFRENKKSMYINFTENDEDCYNGLGYYYLSSFESAVLSAVKYEVAKDSKYATATVSDAETKAQYQVLVEKQKEEYAVLSNKEQVKKFATTVKENLSSAYYVPIDALCEETFTYNDTEYHYAEKNEDGTYTINMFYIAHILFKWSKDVSDVMDEYLIDRDEEETKQIKTQFVNLLLKTNKSQEGFAVADEMGNELGDAFYTDDDGNILSEEVSAVINALKEALEGAEDPLAVFKDYMTWYNDDSGSMTSALGYYIPMGDIEHGYDGDDFPNMAIDLYLKYLAEGTNPAEGKEISEYAFTSYGIHIEYISFAPFYNVVIDEFGGLGIDKELDLDGTTFKQTIEETLKTQADSNAYNAWSNQYTREEALNNAKKDNGKMKSLLKDLGLK